MPTQYADTYPVTPQPSHLNTPPDHLDDGQSTPQGGQVEPDVEADKGGGA